MKTRVLALSICALWIAAPTFAADGPCRGQEPQGWDVSLVPDDEPGTTMIISGVAHHAETGSPAANVSLYVYQTDAEGYYSENKGMNNRDPRLCVVLRTNEKGEYRIRTVRPADYATGGVRAHVHYVSWAEGLDQETHLLQFAAEVDALPKGGIKRPEDGYSTARVQTIYEDADGVLHVMKDLRVGR